MKRKILAFTFLLTLFAIDLITGIFQIGGLQNDIIRNSLFGIGQLAAVLCGIYAASMFGLKSTTGKSFALITSAICLWMVGGIVFAVDDAFGNTPMFPSFADVIILFGYPLFFLGLLNEMRSGKISLRGGRKILLYLFALVLSLIVCYFEILLPYDSTASLLTNITQASYGFADIVLILCSIFVLLVTIDYQGGKMFYSWLAIFVGVIMQLLGNILFGVYVVGYTEKSGINIVIDLIWRFGYVFFAYGFLSAGILIDEIQTKILRKLRG